MLNSLDDALGFQPPPPIYSEIANIVKGAKKIISKFFALKLYISWEAGTPKKLQDLLQQCWRLDKSTVGDSYIDIYAAERDILYVYGGGRKKRIGRERFDSCAIFVIIPTLVSMCSINCGIIEIVSLIILSS